jgi:dipeptidyl aminopeptidase/acylaminoacyl peptidase
MNTRTRAPFGTWKSPISAQQIAAGGKPLSTLRLDGSHIYWLEGLATEGGRVAAVRARTDQPGEVLTAQPYNVRTRVHEYGGGAYVVASGILYFSNFADNLVYGQDAAGDVRPLTHNSQHRHADFEFDATRRRLIAVREDHSHSDQEARTSLVALPLDSGEVQVELAAGFDFYAAPRLSPDGRQLAWLCWNHPLMPWNGTELWLAEVGADGRLEHASKLAGSETESLCQPAWSPGGQLYVVSDRSGWWNLYRVAGRTLDAVCPMQAEFGEPQWVFGQSMYGFTGEQEVIATCIEQGVSKLGRIDLPTGRWHPIATDYTDFDDLHVGPGFVVALAGSPQIPQQVLRIDLADGRHTVLANSVDELPDSGYLSRPESMSFGSSDGRIAHAFHYPPTNRDHEAPPGELPPLIVTSHGGPTSRSTNSMRRGVQYWTSRGFAVVDVNYGGSNGYGRAYMDLLRGQWGIVDVQDCVAAARHLAEQGLVDPKRMAIRGGSASGFTTLCALIFHDVFKAGASYYGVSDLAGLDADTHKFESHYTSYLVAPPPERERLYRERSPLLRADQLRCPMIFFQGLDDKVVVPAQSEAMVQALKSRRIPVAYLSFEGEGHGFRRMETIRRTLEAELYFYARVFGFEQADDIEPVDIQ